MGPVTFLFIAVVVGLLGISVAVSMHRKPTRPDSAMADFRREMQALAPPSRAESDRQTTPGTSSEPDDGTEPDSDEQ